MEKIEINAEFIVELKSMNEWISKIPRCLPSLPRSEKLLFVDKEGNALTIGEDFSNADIASLYPVKVYRLIRTTEFVTNNGESL